MQYNNHFKFKLTVDRDTVEQSTENNLTPVTVDGPNQLSSGFKTEQVQISNSKKSSDALGLSRNSDSQQTACILGKSIGDQAQQMLAGAYLSDGYHSAVSPNRVHTGVTTLSNQNGYEKPNMFQVNKSMTLASQLQMLSPQTQQFITIRSFLQNLLEKKNSIQNTSLAQPIAASQMPHQDQKGFVADINNQINDLQKIVNQNAQIVKQSPYAQQPKQGCGAEFQNPTQQRTNDSKFNQMGQTQAIPINQVMEKRQSPIQPIPNTSQIPQQAKIRQDASVLQRLTSVGLGNIASKPLVSAPNQGLQNLYRLQSTQNTFNSPTNTKPLQQIINGGGQGANALNDLLAQLIDAKQKSASVHQTAVSVPGTPLIQKSAQLPKWKSQVVGVTPDEQDKDLCQTNEKQADNQQKHDLDNKDTVSVNTCNHQIQSQISKTKISKFSLKGIKNQSDELKPNCMKSQTRSSTLKDKRNAKVKVKTRQHADESPQDLAHDDLIMEEEDESNSPLKSQITSRTFKGIPDEWHETIKVRNPDTRRVKLYFKCMYPDCGSVFKKSCNLRDHFRKHTGQRPFKCSFCHKHFTQSGNLGRHLKNVHNTTMRSDESADEPNTPQNQAPTLGKRVASMNFMGVIEESLAAEKSACNMLIEGQKRRRQSSVDIQNTQTAQGQQSFSTKNEGGMLYSLS